MTTRASTIAIKAISLHDTHHKFLLCPDLELARAISFSELSIGARQMQTQSACNELCPKIGRRFANDIDQKLSDEQKCKITALTLHKFARGIVEKNHGTRKWPLKSYFRIIGQPGNKLFGEMCCLFPRDNARNHPWENFEQQLHQRALEASGSG